ncbi:hypothetical protein ASC66_02955 [Leifsonia sp. Root4]|nr:hypothetical protein ASC66_02955 [Leifsonia sp. Root4]
MTDLSSTEGGGATPPVATSSDSQLVERCKHGDSPAFAELWKRHAAAGRTVARSFTSSLDPDDLVAESFTRIYQLLQKGRGPTAAFRPYLFTTIRNTAASWGRARRETSIDTLESFEDPNSGEAAGLLALDRSLTATAFRTLPTRWQEVLWYSEVESMTPAQIAPLLGMTPNGVSALSYRAREGLRQAWIGAHLNAVSADEDCRWSIERLGGYTRGNLSQRETTRLEKHLDDCARCTIAASEARDVGSRLALVLLPLTAGIGGAAAYTYWLQTGGPTSQLAGAVVAMPASITSGFGGGTATGSGAGTSGGGSAVAGGTVAGILGALAVAAGVIAAVTVGPGLFGSLDAAPPVAVAEAEAAAPGDVATPPSPPPTPVASALPAPLPLVPERIEADTALPSPVASATPTATPAPRPTPTPTPGPSAPPVIPAVPAAPRLDPVDTGSSTLFPLLSGAAEPGATVELTISRDGQGPAGPVAAVTADAATGAWSVAVSRLGDGAELVPGAHTVTARQIAGGATSDASTARSFTLSAPTLTAPLAGSEHREDQLPTLEFAGAPGTALEFSLDGGSGWVGETLDADGRAASALSDLPTGVATVAARYTGSDGRHGPASASSFSVSAAPTAPSAPGFTVDTADGRYFPVIAGTDAVPGADIDVLVDGVSRAAATADSDGHWSLTVTELVADTPYGVAVTQSVGGLSSETSAVTEFALRSPEIASPSDGAGIPLSTDVVLLARGVPGAVITVALATSRDGVPFATDTRAIAVDAAGEATTSFDYRDRNYWDTGTLSVHYSDGTRVGPVASVSLVRAF